MRTLGAFIAAALTAVTLSGCGEGGGSTTAPPGGSSTPAPDGLWWQTQVMYQVYPRSFQDSDGDGTGDLKGIQQRLPYLKELGIGFIWLSPVMLSPMMDFGYDIANYTQIDPLFGSLADLDSLIQAASELGIKILMDFVPNHTSNTSKWFEASRSSKDDPKRDWYVWHAGRSLPDGTREPPNNWASNFGGPEGSSWTWDETTEEYYYHAFGDFQPDLNYTNPEVREAMKNVLRFWLDRGVGGFRIDAVPFLMESPGLQNETVDEACLQSQPLWDCMDHNYTQNVDGIHEIVRGWREVADEYEARVLFGEIYADLDIAMSYYGTADAPEFHVPFNFMLIGEDLGFPNNLSNATVIRHAISEYTKAKPITGHGNWVLGNHDQHRLMDRVGNNTALATAVYSLTNLLPGTPVIYNGDEIAMRDLYIPYDQCQDPACINNPDNFQITGRDPERTPMQWNNSAQAGFSSNPATWLPVNPNYVDVNVQAEQDAASPLSINMRTLAFRTAHPSISMGQITNVPSDLPAHLKDTLVIVEHSGMATIANLDTSNSSIVFDVTSLLTQLTDNVEVAFSTVDGREAVHDFTNFSMMPCEVAVLASSVPASVFV